MDLIVHKKKYICIEYPGIVQNNDKMLETLGGEKTISRVNSEPSRRLELKVRPNDVYCKCTHGDRFNTTSLMMKVTRRRKVNGNPGDSIITKVEILGTVETTYKFRSLMDYQYLPMEHIREEERYQSLLPVLMVDGMKMSSWLQEDPPAPVFIQPLLFSRFDQPSNYHFRREPLQKGSNKVKVDRHPPNIIGRGRKSRTGFAIFLNFEDTPAPEQCTPDCARVLEEKKHELKYLDLIKKAFEDRPVWSRNSLSLVLGLHTSQFKFVLPTVAYYFLTGPWRTFWVRFGYDPRLDPAAKIYQTLDIRIRIPPIPGIEFNYKRSIQLYSLPNKMSTGQGRIGTIEMETLTQTEEQVEDPKQTNMKSGYKFISGELPKHKQVFYQVCDVEMDEVKALVSQNDGQEGTVCHEKEGWYPPNTLEKCRELILKDVRNTVERIKQERGDVKMPSVSKDLKGEENESDFDEDDNLEEVHEYEEFDASEQTTN